MMKSKSWKEKIWICGMFLLALAELCFGAVFPVYADDAHQHGKIQIDVIVDDDKGHEVGIKDVDFLLYYVAAWENNDWMLTLDFADFKGKLDFTDAKSQEKTAKDLYEYVVEKKFLEKEGSSNCDGVIVFDGLDPGIYLMIQRADFVYGGYTYSSAPAVIKIPSHIGDKDYMNVELEPKFTRSSESRGDKPTAPEETNPSETKPDRPSSGHHSSDGSTKPHTTPESSRPDIPTESTSSTESAPSDPEETLPDIPTESSEPSTETPKTGDDSPIGVYVVVMEVSLLVIIGLVILIKKREKDEKHEEK
ncbi:LPXTG cell wall anchor domain-containing protein [Clostridium sp. AM33-3]|uniref:LPXTG cell wall anchor domain-containing protein n=1 Tax=Clostridium sp. AM33-3 TaxID=2292304 RepID=UPI000E521C5F|nr:LPXTG cell wall anchor domain-containing protein [Clostridium sp. AM33-3]RHT19067.1 LPXTG cell wall anchor domain-containing protein [Clostridium sp. AM33-3]